jgi:hypothetical protein
MYLASILMLLSWPAMIVVSYFIIRWVLIRYEKKKRASGETTHY